VGERIEGVSGINTAEYFDVLFTGTTKVLSLFIEKYTLQYT
jgi:hypothetical protein